MLRPVIEFKKVASGLPSGFHPSLDRSQNNESCCLLPNLTQDFVGADVVIRCLLLAGVARTTEVRCCRCFRNRIAAPGNQCAALGRSRSGQTITRLLTL